MWAKVSTNCVPIKHIMQKSNSHCVIYPDKWRLNKNRSPELPMDWLVIRFNVHQYSMAVWSQAGHSDLGPWKTHNDGDIKGNHHYEWRLWSRYEASSLGPQQANEHIHFICFRFHFQPFQPLQWRTVKTVGMLETLERFPLTNWIKVNS